MYLLTNAKSELLRFYLHSGSVVETPNMFFSLHKFSGRWVGWSCNKLKNNLYIFERRSLAQLIFFNISDLRNYFVSLLNGPIIISDSGLHIALPINFTAGSHSDSVWLCSFISVVWHSLGSHCTGSEICVCIGPSAFSGVSRTGLPACKCHCSVWELLAPRDDSFGKIRFYILCCSWLPLYC